MDVRKMAGWCLILFGVMNVLQGVHQYATLASGMSTLDTLVTSLLFTAGAACLLLNRRAARS